MFSKASRILPLRASDPLPEKILDFTALVVAIKVTAFVIAGLGIFHSLPYFLYAALILGGCKTFQNWQKMSPFEKEALNPEILFQHAPILNMVGAPALRIFRFFSFNEIQKNNDQRAK